MWLGLFLFILLVKDSSGFFNLAYTPSRNIYASASMSEPPEQPSWSAARAINGNTDQTITSNCAVMDFSKNYKSVWWKVRLAKRYNVAYLEVFFRKNFIQRSSGYSFYIYDTSDTFDALSPVLKNLIYRHDPLSGCPSPFQNITVNRLGVEIIFTNQRPEGYVSSCNGDDMTRTGVELCEVRVMGCNQNRYSSNQCATLCPQKCRNRNCDAFNGSCIYGCNDPNALTLDCIVCKDMEYIWNRTCVSCQGHCKDGSPCNKSTGRCDNGCQNHWMGEFCKVCKDGFYGSSCENNCGHCLNGELCDKRNGTCIKGCQPHFLYPLCKECEDGFYGVNCSDKCGQCDDNDVCDKRTGYCLMGCKTNLQPPFCKDPSELQSISGTSIDEKHNVPETALYVAIGLLTTLLVLSIGVIICQRRRITGLLRNRHSTENTQTRSETQTQNYVDITQSEEKHEYTSLDTVTQESHYNVI
uniref:Uncharacterized protein LOC111115721 isoform X2 n=1 Tax=Crassostrea virginica TaxID=6565 RepID=A0A8B8C3V1_CRAVI|nr:uncharacterized protein LOC111115721 isoform X2 [Crassostrea virginica]